MIHCPHGRAALLGTDLTDPEVIPYFTWEAPMTVAQIQERLRTSSEADRLYLIGKIFERERLPGSNV